MNRQSAGNRHGAVVRRGPLSPEQDGLWLLEQSGAAGVYHNVMAVECRGHVDRCTLADALATVAARHEALRTTFTTDQGQVIQEVLNEPGVLLEDLATGEYGPATIQDAISRARAWASAPFPLRTRHAPPIRASLTPTGQDASLLVLVAHHLISDGDSMMIILRELLAAYEARVRGQPDPPGVPPAQFLDVMASRRGTGAIAAKDIAFWREHLKGAPEVVDLPLDRLRPHRPSYLGAVWQRAFEPGTIQAVRELARAQRVSVFMIILASLAVLLTRLAGTDEVVVGIPMSLRRGPSSRGTVGYLVNTIALRIPVDRDAPVRDLLADVRRVTLRGYDRNHVPFSSVVRELRPARRPDHHPVFQMLFAFTDRGNATADQYAEPVAGLELAFPAVEPKKARTDVSFCVHEVAGTLAVDVEYAADLCDEATAAALAAALESVLAASARSPSSPVRALPMATGQRPRGAVTAAARPGPLRDLLGRAAEIARQDMGRTVLSCPECAVTAGQLHAGTPGGALPPDTTPCGRVASALRALRSPGDLSGAAAGSLPCMDPGILGAAVSWLLSRPSPLSAAERVVLAGRLSSPAAFTVLLARAIACQETIAGDEEWASLLAGDGSETVVGTSAALLEGLTEVRQRAARLAGVVVTGEPPLPQPWAELARTAGGFPVHYVGGPAELGGIAFAADVLAAGCTGRVLGRPLEPFRVTITDTGGQVPPLLAGSLHVLAPGSETAALVCRARAHHGEMIEMIGPAGRENPVSPPLCQLEGTIAVIAGAGDVHAAWRRGPGGLRLCAEIVPRPGARLAAEEVTRRLRDHLAAHLIPAEITMRPRLPEPTDGWLRRAVPADDSSSLGARLLAELTE